MAIARKDGSIEKGPDFVRRLKAELREEGYSDTDVEVMAARLAKDTRFNRLVSDVYVPLSGTT
jgi:regulator of sirC expression with transglutaminase-like and TPR domain